MGRPRAAAGMMISTLLAHSDTEVERAAKVLSWSLPQW